MLWTWTLVCLILGEFLIYFILVVSKTLLPYRIAPEIRFMTMFYALCLSLFIIGGISFFSYNDTKERMRDLDVVYDQIVSLVEVGDTIMLMESSQRVFLITGSESYLDPYNRLKESMGGKMETASKVYKGTTDEVMFDVFRDLVKNKTALLDKNIETKKHGKQEDIEKSLLLDESRNLMSVLIKTGRDLQDRRMAEYTRIMSGFWGLSTIRVYLSLLLMGAALVQIGIAAVLGRSKTPIQSSEPAPVEIFFRKKGEKLG